MLLVLFSRTSPQPLFFCIPSISPAESQRRFASKNANVYLRYYWWLSHKYVLDRVDRAGLSLDADWGGWYLAVGGFHGKHNGGERELFTYSTRIRIAAAYITAALQSSLFGSIES
jgi:hypothetical protein